jgi:hypothetical protein
MADPDYGTFINGQRTSSTTVNTARTDGKTGEHIVSAVSGLLRVNDEWQPKDKAAQRFKDDVIRRLEQLLNNTTLGSGEGSGGGAGGGSVPPGGGGGGPGTGPDTFYDTGYFFVQANSEYTKNHTLGQIPTQFTIFYSNTLEPDPKNTQHVIRLIHSGIVKGYHSGAEQRTGISIRFTDQDEIKIKTVDKITDNGPSAPANGYIRIMMWR